MQWLYTLIPMLGYGIIDTLTAGTSKRVPAFYFVLLQNFVTMALFAITVTLFIPTKLFSDSAALFAMAGGFFLVLGFLSFIKGLSLGKAGVITAFAHGYILVSAILGMLLLNETTTFIRLSSIIIVLIGLTLLSVDFKDLKGSSLMNSESGVIYALGTMFGWGIGYFFQKLAAESLPIFEAALLVEMGAFIVPLFILLFTKKSLGTYKTFRIYDIGVILFVAVGFFVIQTSLMTAFNTFELGLVTTIAGSSSILTAVLSYFFYQQKLNLRETAGILVTVIGLGILGWFS